MDEERSDSVAEEVADAAAPADEGSGAPISEPSASATEVKNLIEKGKAAWRGFLVTDGNALPYEEELNQVFAELDRVVFNFEQREDSWEMVREENAQLRRERDFAIQNAEKLSDNLNTERGAREAAQTESQLAYENFLDLGERVEFLQEQARINERRVYMFSDRAERSEEALRNMRDDRCSCGGQFKLVGSEVRCDTCSRFEGYGVPAHWKEKASEILAEAVRKAMRDQ